MPLLSPIHATRHAHHIPLDLITRTILGEQYRSLSSSLCNFLHFPVTSPLLGPNIPLNILFSNTLSLRSSLNISDQVSHPYKTTGEIIVVYILIFKFVKANWKTKDSAPNNSKHSLTAICAAVCLVGRNGNMKVLWFNSYCLRANSDAILDALFPKINICPS